MKGGVDIARQRNTIKKQVVDNMKSLGVYKLEFRSTIDIFVDMLYQYEIFSEQFEKEGYSVQEEYTNKANATNMRKTPIYSAMEKLRMDLSTYSNLLCLNPRSLETVKVEKNKKSTLSILLSQLDEEER